MKEIRVVRVKRKDGTGSVTGSCDFCECFPCKHVTEQGYWVEDHQWKLNNEEELRWIQRLLVFEKLRLEKIEERSDLENHQLFLTKWLLNEAAKLEEGWKGE